MSDLISRQWLMECVNEGWIKFDTEKDENRFIHLVRDIAPSAQPERPFEIQDILDYLDTALHPIVSPEYWNVYSELYDMISMLPSAEWWIPVTERLPEEKDAGILKALRIEKRSEYVLATVDVKGEKMTATACTLDGKWNWDLKYAFPDFKVVAWMPLPTPYKGGEEE